jgi:hypothetical protein
MEEHTEEYIMAKTIAIKFAQYLRPYVVFNERCCLPTLDGDEPVWENISDVFDVFMQSQRGALPFNN